MNDWILEDEIEDGLRLYRGQKKRLSELVLLVDRTEEAKRFAWRNAFVPSVLDDMAQIVGSRVPTHTRGSSPWGNRELLWHKALLLRSVSREKGRLLVVGKDLADAKKNRMMVLRGMQVYLMARTLGVPVPLHRAEAIRLQSGYQRNYSKRGEKAKHQSKENFPREIPAKEMACRQELLDMIASLQEKNVLQGTWGNLSLRLDEEYMICTPSGIPYDEISVYDLVRVHIKTQAYEGTMHPTGEVELHCSIYRMQKESGCVIHTHPLYGCAYAAARQPFYPEEEAVKKLGHFVPVAKYAPPMSHSLSNEVMRVMSHTPACIMANHGVCVSGTSGADAMERSLLLEEAMKAKIR